MLTAKCLDGKLQAHVTAFFSEAPAVGRNHSDLHPEVALSKSST